MPTSCELCPKPMWHMFKPPPALACKREFLVLFWHQKSINVLLCCAGCRFKIHKEHLDRKNENKIAPCKVYNDSNAAKELLLLANTTEHQQTWINYLRKKIEQGGYAAAIQQNQRHQSSVSVNSNLSGGNSKEHLKNQLNRSFASNTDLNSLNDTSSVISYSHHRSSQNIGSVKNMSSSQHSPNSQNPSTTASSKSATLPQLSAAAAYALASQISTVSADANLTPNSDNNSSESSINSVSNCSLNNTNNGQHNSTPASP